MSSLDELLLLMNRGCAGNAPGGEVRLALAGSRDELGEKKNIWRQAREPQVPPPVSRPPTTPSVLKRAI